jgi:transmembrane sensor
VTANDRSEEHVRRVAEAAAWRTRLTELGQESSEDFETWLATDPANEAAWRLVDVPLALLADNATAPRVIAARRDALDRAHRRSRPALPTWTRIAAGLAMIGLAAIFFVGFNWWDSRPDVYATGHAERRIVRLADGSRVSLDAETEIKVRLEEGARRLELVRGQARFDVAHDATRPFSVRAGDQTVIATGTAFNIDMLGSRVLVTLIEGRVEVMPSGPDAGHGSMILAAGQQLAVAPRARPILRQADLDSTTAWTNGQLIFADEPLSSVVARVARYADYPITVSPDAASLRVSGVFQTSDVDGFLRSITAYLPVQARRAPEGGVVLERRD